MMERYIRFIVRHRVAVVVAVLAVTALLATQLRHVHLEIRRRANMPEQHPYVQIENRISDLFGGGAVVIIGVITTKGDIFTPNTLGKVYRITHGLLSIPGIVESSLLSIAAPHVKAVVAGSDGMMDVHSLMDEAPTTVEQSLKLRGTIRRDKLLADNLISRDERAAVIVAEFNDQQPEMAITERIEELVAPERDNTVTIALAGPPILRAWLARYTAMIGLLFPLAVIVIGLVHYEAFRSLQAMFLPLVTALLSVIWALGIMGLSGQPMDTWSAVTPLVILAVAAGHAVQILKRYYEEYAIVGDSEAAVVRSVAAVGPVMLTAGLIASAGFGSLVTFGVTSVRVLGLLLASGILSALVIEMTFTPACRCMLGTPKASELQREGQWHWLDYALGALSDAVVRRPRMILIGALSTLGVVGMGTPAIRVDNSFRLWFSPSSQIRRDDDILNRELPGTASFRILVEGDQANVIEEPVVLQAISDLGDFIEHNDEIGSVISLADQVKRMHQAMNSNAPTFHAVPDNQRLIAQYLLLYSMSAGPNGLSALVDSNYQRAVIRGLSKTDTAAFSRSLLNQLRGYATERFRGLPVTVGIAGGALGVQTAMNDVIVHEKLISIIQVSMIIFALSAVVLRSLLGGLFVCVPLACAVVVNLGIMGWSHTWLDMTSAAITAMGVSIGADFAIYLIFRIREGVAIGATIEDATRTGLRTCGKAIVFVSGAVVAGYMVLLLSGFNVWVRLGVLTSIIISVSAVTTLVVIPCLVLIVRPRFVLNVSRGWLHQGWRVA